MDAIVASLRGLSGGSLLFLRTCSPMVFTLVALFVGFLVYLYAPYWRVRKVPGPPATPLLGHLPLFDKYGLDVFRVLARDYGPICRFHMGRQPLIVVSDPELCKEVGIKKFKDIKNRSVPFPLAGSPIYLEGLFLTRDSRWTQMRSTITSLYRPAILASLIPTMQSYVESLFLNVSKHQQKKEDITFADLSLQLAVDVIGKTAFGVEFKLLKELSDQNSNKDHKNINNDDEEDVAPLVELHNRAMKFVKMDSSSPFSTVLGLLAPALQKPAREILKRLPWTADYKKQQTIRQLCKQLDVVIAKRSAEKTQESKDFLGAVLNATEMSEADKKLFTHNYVQALAYEHLVAGTKTTAFTLAMTIYLVTKHPEVERKLLSEIDNFEPRNVIPTAEDLQTKFPYLDLVIKEVMRFYTAVPLVARETSQQIELGGYVLPKGTWVWMAVEVIAKDPKHFPEPEAFRPERFDPNCEEEKQRHPYAHIPFGIGPRACIGQRFALQEIKLALIHLYRSYVFELSPDMKTPLELEYGLTVAVKKDALKLRAVKRQI